MHAFGPLSTLFHAADRPRASDAEIAWYAQHVPPGAHSHELKCGYGRLLVDSLIPEATEKSGRVAGLATTLGFAVAAGLSTLTA